MKKLFGCLVFFSLAGIARADLRNLPATLTTLSVTTATITNLVGTTTNDSANVGNFGQYVSSTSVGFISFPTTTQFGDLLSIQLTAGDWDVNLCIFGTANGATVTLIQSGISSTTGNSSVGLVNGDNANDVFIPTIATDSAGCISGVRLSLASTTTYYLKFSATYTVATPQARGRISARRVR